MDYNKALQKCMHLCSRNEYCKSDIRQKLKKMQLLNNEADKIIDYLVDNKYVDELRYTNAYVNDKFKFNHWGKIKISYYLKHKAIGNSLIEMALEKINMEDYESVCKIEIEKKKPKVAAESDFERNGKVAKYVISKGFESDLVFRLLKSQNIHLDHM